MDQFCQWSEADKLNSILLARRQATRNLCPLPILLGIGAIVTRFVLQRKSRMNYVFPSAMGQH
jgi:hypothetical protein